MHSLFGSGARRLILVVVAVLLATGEAVWWLWSPAPPLRPDFVIVPTGLVSIVDPRDVDDLARFEARSGTWVHAGRVLVSPRQIAYLGQMLPAQPFSKGLATNEPDSAIASRPASKKPQTRSDDGQSGGAHFGYIIARLGANASAQTMHRALEDIAAAGICHFGFYDPNGKLHHGEPEIFLYRIVSVRASNAPDASTDSAEAGTVTSCREHLNGLVPAPPRDHERPGRKSARSQSTPDKTTHSRAGQSRDTASSPSR